MASDHTAHGGHSGNSHGSHGRPYLMFWINMILGLIVMYVVMFSGVTSGGMVTSGTTCWTWKDNMVNITRHAALACDAHEEHMTL